MGFDRIACKTGLGRSQQQRSIESTKLLALSPNTNPTNLLQQNRNPKINNTTNQDQTERESVCERWGVQEVIVSAESDEVMKAFNWGALEDWPLTTEEGDYDC